MSETALHPTPPARGVLLEQLRAVALELRGVALALGALLLLATLAVLVAEVRQGEVIDFHPEEWMLPGAAGVLLPIAVWRGKDRFGPGFFWSLPVDRRAHALARVAAGWAWLMAAVAVFVLWLLGLTLASGGSVLPTEVLRVVPPAVADVGPIDPRGLWTVVWTPKPVLWLVPFTAATATYLLASAVALWTRHLLRWLGGIFLALFLVAGLGELTGAEPLIFAPARLLRSLLFGPYGVDTLFTAGIESLRTETTLPTGERLAVWRGVPDLALWARATLLWTLVGLLALWAAASRHRERRRP